MIETLFYQLYIYFVASISHAGLIFEGYSKAGLSFFGVLVYFPSAFSNVHHQKEHSLAHCLSIQRLSKKKQTDDESSDEKRGNLKFNFV